MLEVLEHIELNMIEENFIPNLIKGFNMDSNQSEIVIRMSKIIGKIVHKLSHFDLHTKYQEELLSFYKAIVNHEDDQCVENGIYNLPCFHSLYRDKVKKPPMTADTESTQVTDTANVEENKFDEDLKPPEEIDFHDLYLQYANK